MARPIFTPMFEEDESAIKSRVLERIPDDWRKEPGDFIHDAVAAAPAEVKQLQMLQDFILQNSFAQYAVGQWLDERAYEIGLFRNMATPAKRQINVTAAAGVSIPAGHTVSVVILDNNGTPIEYTVDAAVTFSTADTLPVTVTCKTAGTLGNVPNGTQFMLQPPLPGVTAITDGAAVVLGDDTETDDAFFKRYDFRIMNPDTGGNRNDYVRWVLEEFPEVVGNAKCFPRWAGNNTVRVVIVGANMLPAAQTLIDDVQAFLDPGKTGLGDGKAPCGAVVTVASATSLAVNVTATVTYANGYTPSAVKAAFETALGSYLSGLVFTGKPVLYNMVGSLLMTTPGVENYTELTMNGGAADVLPGAEEVATLGTVTM